MLAAILACGLLTTSCVDDKTVPDNPSSTPEQASAKDPGIWWIDENNMDKSVKPGDNFYMYCNGTWWKNAAVDPIYHYTSRLSEMKPTFNERVNSLTDANYAIYKSHLKWADPNSEAAASAQKLYDDMLKQSGLADATTTIDVLRAFGKMATMGVWTCCAPSARWRPWACAHASSCSLSAITTRSASMPRTTSRTLLRNQAISLMPLGVPYSPRSARSSASIPM